MTVEQIRSEIAAHELDIKRNPNDAENSEYHGPAIHYLKQELERRGESL